MPVKIRPKNGTISLFKYSGEYERQSLSPGRSAATARPVCTGVNCRRGRERGRRVFPTLTGKIAGRAAWACRPAAVAAAAPRETRARCPVDRDYPAEHHARQASARRAGRPRLQRGSQPFGGRGTICAGRAAPASTGAMLATMSSARSCWDPASIACRPGNSNKAARWTHRHPGIWGLSSSGTKTPIHGGCRLPTQLRRRPRGLGLDPTVVSPAAKLVNECEVGLNRGHAIERAG